MARYSKAEASKFIEEDGIVPLFFHGDDAVCRSVARAVYASRCHSLEFTNRGEGALTSFEAITTLVRQEFPGKLVGAGSINDPSVAAQFLDRGADFIVGPGFSEGVARLCNEQDVLYVPGCATVTEILRATEFGVVIVKLFPADALGGPGFLKAIRGPLPWLRAMVTGGVRANEASLTEWFAAGAVAVGLGSDLIGKEVLAGCNVDSLTTQLDELLRVARNCRG